LKDRGLRLAIPYGKNFTIADRTRAVGRYARSFKDSLIVFCTRRDYALHDKFISPVAYIISYLFPVVEEILGVAKVLKTMEHTAINRTTDFNSFGVGFFTCIPFVKFVDAFKRIVEFVTPAKIEVAIILYGTIELDRIIPERREAEVNLVLIFFSFRDFVVLIPSFSVREQTCVKGFVADNVVVSDFAFFIDVVGVEIKAHSQ
jgi:hypothetical protein